MEVKVEPVVGVKDYYTLTVTDPYNKVTILTLERSEARHIIQALDNAI
tara:strand:- start:112 stop:255 length:144 start_codon:yes stop_codon:yes gene_type:complete